MTIQELFQSGREALSRVVVGNEEAVDAVLAALVLESHVLIEGPPGTAKTLMVRALARATGLDYVRIQFTPDLMPSDLTGTMVFLQNEGRFELRKGPVFASMVLADEINRTPPKTQAALLEAMEEGQVTIEGETLRAAAAVHRVRNREPDRVRGHLPVARGAARPVPVQAHRRVSRSGRRARDHQPSQDRISRRATSTRSRYRGSSTPKPCPRCARRPRRSASTDDVVTYIAQISQWLRASDDVVFGPSPRGSIGLLLAARVMAAARGADFVTPDDVQSLAPAVLRHRIVLAADAELSGRSADDVVAAALGAVIVPR